jgi:hypothetical protein
MKVQTLKTYHHVSLYHRSESSVPRKVRANGLSICIMNVEISLPSDIANSCNTITDGSDHGPWIEFTGYNSPRPNRYGDSTCEAAKVACAMLNPKNAVAYSQAAQAQAPVLCILRRSSDLEEKNQGGIGYYGSRGTVPKARSRTA